MVDKLVEEYKRDLKELKKLHKEILTKRYQAPVRDNTGKQVVSKKGDKVFRLVDDRTPQDIADQKTIAEAISTTEYALFWLETGREKPFDEEQAQKIPRHRRMISVADIEQMSYQVYLQNVEEPVERMSEEKREMLLQVTEIESLLSGKELELFHLINKELLTYGEAASQMGLAVGTVKSMSQRIKNKIEKYFEYGHQIQLF